MKILDILDRKHLLKMRHKNQNQNQNYCHSTDRTKIGVILLIRQKSDCYSCWCVKKPHNVHNSSIGKDSKGTVEQKGEAAIENSKYVCVCVLSTLPPPQKTLNSAKKETQYFHIHIMKVH